MCLSTYALLCGHTSRVVPWGQRQFLKKGKRSREKTTTARQVSSISYHLSIHPFIHPPDIERLGSYVYNPKPASHTLQSTKYSSAYHPIQITHPVHQIKNQENVLRHLLLLLQAPIPAHRARANILPVRTARQRRASGEMEFSE